MNIVYPTLAAEDVDPLVSPVDLTVDILASSVDIRRCYRSVAELFPNGE